MKFGKPLKEELEMERYAPDTSASAVVLVDYGESRIIWNQSQGFQVLFERYTRIKVFEKDGYDWADVAIALYESDGSRERMGSIKGYTYNLKGGRVEETKLEKSAIFSEQVSEHWSQEKFTMPNVKQGSVIEFTYSITSDFLFQLRDWSFQRTIPTAWSEYEAIIPEYFDYKQLSQGYIAMAIKEHNTTIGFYNYTSKGRNAYSGGGGLSTSKIEFKNHNYRWAAKDVPAFKEERFITSVEDHLSRIQFELSSIKYPNQPVEQIMDTWETLDRKLKQSDYFGDAIKRNGFIKDQVASITSKSATDLEKLKSIYSFVQENMKWNGKKTLYVESTLKDAYHNHEGNAADVNLLLVSMLQMAGLQANPVVLSTRDHGQIFEFYPILSRFNYVIVQVNADGKQYLVDATDKYTPLNSLPYRCLNNLGRRISEKSGWVDLTTTGQVQDLQRFELTLHIDGKLEGTMVESKKGFTAASTRGEITRQGADKFVKDKFGNTPGWNIKTYSFDNLEEYDKELVGSYEITLNETAQSLGDIIYLDPVISEGLKENPFRIENRQYPVDMGCPSVQTYMVNITLPDGYSVDELPTSSALKMPDGSAVYHYNVQQVGNTINLMSRINIKKAVYTSDEYASLKEFFNMIIDKHNQQVVLKKI